MAEENGTTVLLVTTSTMVLVFGLLVLDGAEWYVQYPVLAASLLLSLFAVVRAERVRS